LRSIPIIGMVERNAQMTLLPPPASVTTPEWLTATLVVAAIVLAILAVGFMFRRVAVPDRDPATDADEGADPATPATRQYPAVYYDPVLVISALIVIGLAVAVWLVR
jgi:hypothetical protein